MEITKEMILEQLALYHNMVDELKGLITVIEDELGMDSHQLSELLDLRSPSSAIKDRAQAAAITLTHELPSGNAVCLPRLKIERGGEMMTITQSMHSDEDALSVCIYDTNRDDNGYSTYQASITNLITVNGEKSEFDIALAEIKKGEIAEVNNLPKGNQNVDIYVYDDPYDENYTHKFTIKREDMEKAVTQY